MSHRCFHFLSCSITVVHWMEVSYTGIFYSVSKMMKTLKAFWFAIFMAVAVTEGTLNPYCISPQYMELGENGSLSCDFGESYYAVYWFNTTIDEAPLIYRKESKLEGNSLADYDVLENGTLVIKRVAWEHDKTFTFMMLPTPEDVIDGQVEAKVTVKPNQRFPYISGCSDTRICTRQVQKDEDISCSVFDARPPVALTWVKLSSHNETLQNSQQFFTSGKEIIYTTTTISVAAFEPQMLEIFTCRASYSAPDLLLKNESIMIADVENRHQRLTMLTPIKKRVHLRTAAELQCTFSNGLMWKWVLVLSGSIELIGIYVVGEKTHMEHKEFEITERGALSLSMADFRHDALFACIAGDGITEIEKSYNVSIFVLPTPEYPVIDGCHSSGYCVMRIKQHHGKITCRVTGIYPRVSLVWKEIGNLKKNSITLTENETTVVNKGGTYDVLLSSSYTMKPDIYTNRVTLECTSNGWNMGSTELSTVFELLLDVEVPSELQPTMDNFPRKNHLKWSLPVVVLILVLAVVAFLFKDKICKTQSTESIRIGKDEEEVPMVDHLDSGRFKELLADRYRTWYSNIRPIPIIKDKSYCVNDLFVESGMQLFRSKTKIESEGNWERTQLEDHMHQTSSDKIKVIVEGGPGYGKSTTALKLAYDWCENSQYLSSVQLLIILRLRYMKPSETFESAVSRLLLPLEERYTEPNIIDILKSVKSLMIVLDGLDEYPDRDNTESEIRHIIQGEMFPGHHVLVFTRPSHLPEKYHAATKRLRLTGFNEDAQKRYLSKALQITDPKHAERILNHLKGNPVLRDVCSVPLFFVLFAHLDHESEAFKDIECVTTFFKYVISCFINHYREKANSGYKIDESTIKSYESHHEQLDEFAFQLITAKETSKTLERNTIRSKLGSSFYDFYVATGILIEEDIVNLLPTSGSNELHISFCHKLFCEWYAAHHLVELTGEKVTFETARENMSNLKPLDLHFVLRFACGINNKSAERIRKYLKLVPHGDMIDVLCILEQKGYLDESAETVTSLCSKTMIFKSEDEDDFLQARILLLQLASFQGIPIKQLWIQNMLSSVDMEKEELILKNDLRLPTLTTLQELHVQRDGKSSLCEEELKNIMKYALSNDNLNFIGLYYADLPEYVGAEVLNILKQRNITVIWKPSPLRKLHLNKEKGSWEK